MKRKSPILEWLKRTSVWNLLWISVVLSEICTAALSTLMGWLWWGEISTDLILIGAIIGGVVALAVTAVVILAFREMRAAEREADKSRRQLRSLREREEMSRWLHDDIGSDLFNIILVAESLQQRQVDADDVNEFLDHITAASRNALGSIRRFLNFSERVGPTMGDLAGYLADYGRALFRNRGIDFLFSDLLPEPKAPLLPMKSFSVYLIYKEALTNILRHARAKNVDIRLAEIDGRLEITIRDDGRGFGPEALADERGGTKNITYRAEAIGGTIRFDSEPGQGTSVHLTVPV